MRLSIDLNQKDESVIIWRSTGEHIHKEKFTQFGINQITIKQIELFKSSVTTSIRILNALRDRFDPILPKKLEFDPDVILNFI